MLSYRTVEPHTLELLKKLMAAKCLSGTRLVGGTGLALQYGHLINEGRHTETSGSLFPLNR